MFQEYLEERAGPAVVLDPGAEAGAWELAALLLSWQLVKALQEPIQWSGSAVACLLEADLVD